MNESNHTEAFSLLIKEIGKFFTQDMEFLKPFKIQINHFDEHKLQLQFAMNPQLQGNMLQKILHGGASATVLDSASGMLAMIATFAKEKDKPVEEQFARAAKAATIDLRIDYLRPGRGEYFLVDANVLRCGNKITAIQSYLYNEQKTLLATAIGTYMIGH